MAGGLRGGYSTQTSNPLQQSTLHHTTLVQSDPATSMKLYQQGGVSNLYISNDLVSRRIQFQAAKSHDANSLTSSKLIPLNKPVNMELDRYSKHHVAGLSNKFTDASSKQGQPKWQSTAGTAAGKKVSHIVIHWKQVQGIGAGLHNLGNTCFLNSVLQCLTYTPPLVNFLQSQQSKQHAQGGNCARSATFCALCELSKLVSKALASGGGAVGPTPLVRGLRSLSRSFRVGRQEDAHEYMVHLLESLHKSLLPPAIARSPVACAKADSFVSECFGGKLRSSVQCSQCGHCSDTLDPFLHLSLDIRRAESVRKAMDRFTAVEWLDGDNKYKCSVCGGRVRASKRFSLDTTPPVLTVQLKRFSAVTGGKIDKMVEYGTAMDVAPYLTSGRKAKQGMMSATTTVSSSSSHGCNSTHYSLYAVLVHAGWSTHSGHYYAFVKSPAGTWHAMDDSRVRPVSEKTVLQQKAYMLFYLQEQQKEQKQQEQRTTAPSSKAAATCPPATISTVIPAAGAGVQVVQQQKENVVGGLEAQPCTLPVLQPPQQQQQQGQRQIMPTAVNSSSTAGAEAEAETGAEAEAGAGTGVDPVSQGDSHGQGEGSSCNAGSSSSSSSSSGANIADVYYSADVAGKAWPRTPAALMTLLLTMPASRKCYWMSRAVEQGRRGRKRKNRAEGGEQMDGLSVSASLLLPASRRVTRGMMRGTQEEEEKEEEEEAQCGRIGENEEPNRRGGVEVLAPGGVAAADVHSRPVARGGGGGSNGEGLEAGVTQLSNPERSRDGSHGGSNGQMVKETLRGAAAIKAMNQSNDGGRGGRGNLFNFNVPKWEEVEGQEVSTFVSVQVETKRKRRYDEWDAELDKGRVKKVRKKTEDDNSGNNLNLFQQLAARNDTNYQGGQLPNRKVAKLRRLENRRNGHAKSRF